MFQYPSKKKSQNTSNWLFLINFVEVCFFIIKDPVLNVLLSFENIYHYVTITLKIQQMSITNDTLSLFRPLGKTGVTFMSHCSRGGWKMKMWKVKQYDSQKITLEKTLWLFKGQGFLKIPKAEIRKEIMANWTVLKWRTPILENTSLRDWKDMQIYKKTFDPLIHFCCLMKFLC